MDDPTSFDRLILRCHSDLEINRSWLDGRTVYIFHDTKKGSSYALALREYRVFAAFDGLLTCSQVFDTLKSSGALLASEFDSYRTLATQLIARQILIPIDGQSLNLNSSRTQSKYASISDKIERLIFWKLSLGSPYALLNLLSKWLLWLFTWPAALAVFTCAVLAACTLYLRWNGQQEILTDLYSEQNLFVLISSFCITKLWHEIGHGIACHKFRCPVNNWGIFFIAGTPCAYIDASTSWSIPNRLQRVIVCFAGIYFEILLAIPAVAVWALSENPWIKSWALHIVVLSTMTTVLFNANPLMKFDGYFALCDLLDIPNLRSRAKAFVSWLLKKTLFGIHTIPPERGIARTLFFTCFGTLAQMYTWTIITGIFVVLMWRIPFAGFVIACVYGCAILAKLIHHVFSFLLKSKEMEEKRLRGLLVISSIVASILCMCLIPIPRHIRLDGFTSYAEELVVRAPVRGTIECEEIEPGQYLEKSDLIASIFAPLITDRAVQSEARLRELNILRNAAVGGDRARLMTLNTEARIASAQQILANKDAEGLEIRLPKSAYFLSWMRNIKNGEKVEDGMSIAKVGIGNVVLKVVCSQRQLVELNPRIGEQVTVSFPWNWKKTYCAEVIRVSQCAAHSLESPVLAANGGGNVPVNPGTLKPLADHVMIEIAIESPPPQAQCMGIRGELHLHNRCISLANWARYRWLSLYREFLKEQA